MSATVMMERFAEASPRFKARTAGVFWLMTILTGMLALSAGDGLKFAANIFATACYAAATLLVYELLKPVNGNLSRLAASFGLLGCACGAVHYVSQIAARVGPSELRALARVFLGVRAQNPNIDFIFFGLQCLLLGYLIFRSTFLPRILGALLAIAGLGWLTLCYASLLAAPLGRSLSPYLMTAGGIGEGSLVLWLLVIGVNVQRWTEQAGSRRNGDRGAGALVSPARQGGRRA